MKKYLFSLALILFLSPLISFAQPCCSYCCCPNYTWAIQGALATGGNLGIGVVNYQRNFEIGATVAGKVNNARNETSVFTPVVFAGLRHYIGCNTVFAYGVDTNARFGKIDGLRIDSAYGIGPYISLEYYLTRRTLLSGWINPYFYDYEKRENRRGVSTNNFFSTGGIGISYFIA